jgi:SAM-dependent methyltransferase
LKACASGQMPGQGLRPEAVGLPSTCQWQVDQSDPEAGKRLPVSGPRLRACLCTNILCEKNGNLVQLWIIMPSCLFCHNPMGSSGLLTCHSCGAGPRDQRMAAAFEHMLQLKQSRENQIILEVGPTPLAPALLVQSDLLGPCTYVAVDLDLPPAAGRLFLPHMALTMDVCELDFDANYFDVVICNNVLGFVHDYKRALNELNRVLKPSGVAFLQNTIPLQKTTPVEVLRRSTYPLFDDRDFNVLGTHWLFGRDYFDILRQARWIPLRFRHHEMEYFLAFKSTRAPVFQRLSPLHEVRTRAAPALETVIKTDRMPIGQLSE